MIATRRYLSLGLFLLLQGVFCVPSVFASEPEEYESYTDVEEEAKIQARIDALDAALELDLAALHGTIRDMSTAEIEALVRLAHILIQGVAQERMMFPQRGEYALPVGSLATFDELAAIVPTLLDQAQYNSDVIPELRNTVERMVQILVDLLRDAARIRELRRSAWQEENLIQCKKERDNCIKNAQEQASLGEQKEAQWRKEREHMQKQLSEYKDEINQLRREKHEALLNS